jgi:nicotinamidase-related amidase
MKQALILVDIQNDYFPNGKMELMGMENASRIARSMLLQFREVHFPVFHIRHISLRPGATFFLPDTPGAEIHKCVAPEKGEMVIEKHYPNSFRDTSLHDLLKKQNVKKIVICGAMSHMCIDATVRAAFDLCFFCTVIKDACATRDLTFDGQIVEAAKVHAAFMGALSSTYARVVSAHEFRIGQE